VLHQRLAELLQQPGLADGALTHLQRLRFHHQKHTVRLDRAGVWIGSRAQRDRAASCVDSAEGIKGGTHHSWMAGKAQRYIR
jgi:hypothetical protein